MKMKKLRLLITEKCNRSCKGCCNKQWDLAALPVETDFSGYDMIILTGGEPMLNLHRVFQSIQEIKEQNTDAAIIMYTAKTDRPSLLLLVLSELDGLTVTIHNKADWESFLAFHDRLSSYDLHAKDLRLNVFKEAGYHGFANDAFWVIKKDVEWIKDCPLPDNEIFKRI